MTIPHGVISIGEWAFCDCNLTSINIPKSVKKIGDDAFYWSGLSEINYESTKADWLRIGKKIGVGRSCKIVCTDGIIE